MTHFILFSPPFLMPTYPEPIFVRLNHMLRSHGDHTVTACDLNLQFLETAVNPDAFQAIQPLINEKINALKIIPEFERTKEHRRRYLNLVQARMIFDAIYSQINLLKNKWSSSFLYGASQFMDAYFSLRYALEILSNLYTPLTLSMVDFVNASEINRLDWQALSEWSAQYQPLFDETLRGAVPPWPADAVLILCVSYLSQFPMAMRICQLLHQQGGSKPLLVGPWIERRAASLLQQDWVTAITEVVTVPDLLARFAIPDASFCPGFADLSPESYWSPIPLHVVLNDPRRPPGGYREMPLGGPMELERVQPWIEEVKAVRQQQRIHYFYFAGSPLPALVLAALAEGLLEEKMLVFWVAEVQFDAGWEQVDIARLFRSGCRMLIFNDLPLSPWRQRFHPNTCPLETLDAVLKSLQQVGIWLHTDLAIGLPGENREEQHQLFRALNDRYQWVGSLHPYPFHCWANGALFQELQAEIKCLAYPGKIQDLLVFIHNRGGLDDYLRAELTLEYERHIRQWPDGVHLWFMRSPAIYQFFAICVLGRDSYAALKPIMPQDNPKLYQGHAESIQAKGRFLPQIGLSVLEQLSYTM